MCRSNSGCVLLVYLFLINSLSFIQVVSYGAEARTLTKKEEQVLLIFERKILRRIYEKGEWKIRTNRELEEMNERENMVK